MSFASRICSVVNLSEYEDIGPTILQGYKIEWKMAMLLMRKFKN